MIYRIIYLPQPSSALHNTENSSPRGAGGGTSQEDDAPRHASQAEDGKDNSDVEATAGYGLMPNLSANICEYDMSAVGDMEEEVDHEEASEVQEKKKKRKKTLEKGSIWQANRMMRAVMPLWLGNPIGPGMADGPDGPDGAYRPLVCAGQVCSWRIIPLRCKGISFYHYLFTWLVS